MLSYFQIHLHHVAILFGVEKLKMKIYKKIWIIIYQLNLAFCYDESNENFQQLCNKELVIARCLGQYWQIFSSFLTFRYYFIYYFIISLCEPFKYVHAGTD